MKGRQVGICMLLVLLLTQLLLALHSFTARPTNTEQRHTPSLAQPGLTPGRDLPVLQH